MNAAAASEMSARGDAEPAPSASGRRRGRFRGGFGSAPAQAGSPLERGRLNRCRREHPLPVGLGSDAAGEGRCSDEQRDETRRHHADWTRASLGDRAPSPGQHRPTYRLRIWGRPQTTPATFKRYLTPSLGVNEAHSRWDVLAALQPVSTARLVLCLLSGRQHACIIP